MNDLAGYLRMFTSSDWVYPLIFVLAVAEASALTSYFLSGTLGFVVVGILISQQLLDPAPAILAIYSGTLIGDLGSYALSARLQRVPFVALAVHRLEWVRASLQATPARFIIIGHFAPYLRALMPVLAAGVVPLRTYLPIELIGAMLGTLFLVGAGYFGASALASLGYGSAVAVVGVAMTCLIVILWFCGRSRSSRKPGAALANLLRGIRFFLWYPFWHPCRWAERWLRAKPSRALRRSLQASFPDIRPGDILTVRLHSPAPWGRWAHSAIAIDGERFCHGFASVVSAHPLSALPVRYAIAHLRVRCPDRLAAAASEIARNCVGRPVSVLARRGDTHRFSCASLITHAYRAAGIELVDREIGRVAPDDLFASPHVELVRVVNTERVGRLIRRYVFEAREEG